MINPVWLEVSTGVNVIVSFELSEGAIVKREGENVNSALVDEIPVT